MKSSNIERICVTALAIALLAVKADPFSVGLGWFIVMCCINGD